MTTKSFPVFDCDAHINDPKQIWEDYVPDSQKELVRDTYWRDDNGGWLNSTTPVIGGGNGQFPGYNPICIAGPQMNKKIMRKLNTMPLTPEQKAYLHHDGAISGKARLTEMDLMGIDQVLVIPTMVIMHVPFAENVEGVDALCRAYNNFVVDWCSEEPTRLFGAAFLPAQDAQRTAAEIERAAGLGLPVGLIRPIDAQAKYPNAAAPSMMAPGEYDAVFKTFEETGMVLGMHTFPAPNYPHPLGPDFLASPGELFNRAGIDSQTFSFIHEMQVWLSQVLLSGLLDRYPKLKMAVFESNAEWLPYTLATCDRLYKLYASERGTAGDRLPSEAFHQQCVISFESDEIGVFRQWKHFAKVGIWASDAYHHDGADSWSAIRNMSECGVPEAVQADLLGGNARRFYGIESKLVVTEEPGPIDRPDWFPGGPELDEWANVIAHPREHPAEMQAMGLDPLSLLSDDSGRAVGSAVVLMPGSVPERHAGSFTVDVDSHVYEPPEIWDRYVPADLRGIAKSAFFHEVDDQGNRLTIVNGVPGRELNRSRLVRQAIWKPGMTVDDIGALDPDVHVPLNPGASNPQARLADMNAMGVGQAVVFPTLFNEYLPLVQNPQAAAALTQGYNDWIWDFAAQSSGRVHPVAILPLHSLLLARRELDRVAEKGFTSVVIRPAFYATEVIEGHSPREQIARAMRDMQRRMTGDAQWTPRHFVETEPFRGLWEQLDDLGMVACIHPSLGITGPDAVSSGAFADRVSARLGVSHTIAEPIAYMQDANLFVTSAFFHGLFEDFPSLRFAFLHSGTSWVPLALEKSETYLWLSPMFAAAFVSLEPEEVWERHPIVVSFDGWEQSVAIMPDRLAGKAAWGSRYPNHDASTPAEARAMLEAENVDAATIDRLMGGNAADLFGLRVPTTV